MQQAKLKSTSDQSVPSGALTVLLLTTQLLTSAEVIGDSVNSIIQLTKSGYYFVCVEILVVGTGKHQVFLTGGGFTSGGTEFMDFSGTADGIAQTMTVLVKAGPATYLQLKALHDAGANRDYRAAISVSRLAES